MAERKKIGELLIEAGAVTETDVRAALARQLGPGKRMRLGEVLMALGATTSVEVAKALALQFGLPFIQLPEIPGRVSGMMPVDYQSQHRIVPFRFETDGRTSEILHVAIDDPTNQDELDEVRFQFRKTVKVYVAASEDIESTLAALRGEIDELAIEDDVEEPEDAEVDLSKPEAAAAKPVLAGVAMPASPAPVAPTVLMAPKGDVAPMPMEWDLPPEQQPMLAAVPSPSPVSLVGASPEGRGAGASRPSVPIVVFPTGTGKPEPAKMLTLVPPLDVPAPQDTPKPPEPAKNGHGAREHAPEEDWFGGAAASPSAEPIEPKAAEKPESVAPAARLDSPETAPTLAADPVVARTEPAPVKIEPATAPLPVAAPPKAEPPLTEALAAKASNDEPRTEPPPSPDAAKTRLEFSEDDLRVLDNLERMAHGQQPLPAVERVTPGRMVATLIRLLVQKGVIDEIDFLEELARK